MPQVPSQRPWAAKALRLHVAFLGREQDQLQQEREEAEPADRQLLAREREAREEEEVVVVQEEARGALGQEKPV